MGVFITVLGLGCVIFVHEMGHYLAALFVKVRVYEFSIGFGPKLVVKRWRDTDYALRVLPLGGFVRLAGMDDSEDDQCTDEDSYQTKSVFSRMFIIVAGSVVNILFGFVFFMCVAFCFGIPVLSPVLSSVLDGGEAHRVGMQSGDRILFVNGDIVYDVQRDFVERVKASEGQPLMITYERDSLRSQVRVVPKKMGSEKITRIGVMLSSTSEKWQFWGSIGYGFKQLSYYTVMVFKSLYYLFSGRASVKDLAGPVGIVQMATFQFDQGVMIFLHFMAMISVSLGVINLFPIPAVDGGHFMFLLYELITSKKASKRVYMTIQAVGVVLLLLLMVFVVMNDVINWSARSAFIHSLR